MMKNLLLLCVLLFTLFPISWSQLKFEVNANAGGTIVDIEKLVEIDENENTIATDWGQFSSGLSAQLFYTSIGNISMGTELGYQYLFWYSVRIPYGSSPIYREYDVSVFKIAQVFRFGGEKSFNLDLGPEICISSGGVMPGIFGSVNYFYKLTDKIDIPLKIRAEVMSGIVFIAPVSLQTGIRVNL